MLGADHGWDHLTGGWPSAASLAFGGEGGRRIRTEPPNSTNGDTLRHVRTGRFVLVLWVTALAAFWGVSWLRGIGPVDALEGALAGAAAEPWAVPLLLGVYVLRSVLFVPMTLLTVFAGFLLGPWWGAVVALVGSVGSALVSYSLARLVRGGGRTPAAVAHGSVDGAVGGRTPGEEAAPAAPPGAPGARPVPATPRRAP